MPWEIFEGKRSKTSGELLVSITKPGRVTLTLPVYEKFFKGYTHVLFAYDPEKRRIGIKPLKEPLPNAYPISHPSRVRTGGYYVTATAFFKHYDINLEQPLRKVVYKEGDFVVIDLD